MDQKKQLESLLTASEVLHASLDLKELLRRMMDIISEVMMSERGAIYLADKATGEMVLSMAQERDFETAASLKVARPEGARAFVAGQGVPVLIEDAGRDPRYKGAASAEAGKSVLCVPLKQGEELIGVIEVANRKSGEAYGFEDLALFQGLANICAGAMMNGRKFATVEAENRKLKERAGEEEVRFIGNSPAVRRILGVVKKVAPGNTIVLITGESGTGKELIARTLHDLSPRRAMPFMPLNCGALPETLLESELFGHEKGAFTGADRPRAGIFEEAKGGTVFLDEIGETTLSTQIKLLRVLQEGKIKRIGSNKEVAVDARILSATNRDLEELIREKRFREDLFYRLNVVRIPVPPLRERGEDIPLLADFFLRKSREKQSKKIEGFSSGVLRLFLGHDWKGNIRELENVVESAVAMTDGPYIEPCDLPPVFQDKGSGGFNAGSLVHLAYEAAHDEFERQYFGQLLLLHNGDTAAAAEKAGVSEKSVYRRKKQFGL